MGLLAPAALLFAGLFIPVVAMYFIRQQREREVLPTIVLWARFVKEQMESRRLQRFQNSILLWLQLAFLAALILALSRPFRRGAGQPGQATVVVLDASASMQTREDGGSRFEIAKEEIADLIGGLGGSDRVMLVAAGPRPWVVQGLTEDVRSVERALDDLVCTDGSASLDAALRAAMQAAGPGKPPAIHVWTDGAGDALDGVAAMQAPVTWHAVGETRDNVAVTALAVRRHPENPLDLDVFATLENTGPEARSVAVKLELDRRLLAFKKATLAPGETLTLTEPVLAGRGGIVRVNAETADALAVDNSAALTLHTTEKFQIVLVSQGNAFLRRVFGLLPGVALRTVRPGANLDRANADLVVFDRAMPRTWPREPALVLGPRAHPLLQGVRAVSTPRITTWRREHPLLHRLTFADVHVSQGLVQTASTGVPLVSSQDGPLIWEQRENGSRQVVVGFSLQHSDWILRPSFPLFLANLVDGLRDTSGATSDALRVGDTIQIPASLEVTEAEVTYPDGRTAVATARSGALTVDDTWQSGEYRIEAPRLHTTQVISALNPTESDIMPRAMPESAIPESEAIRAGITREYWPWLIVLALLLSLAEWTLYHRRGL